MKKGTIDRDGFQLGYSIEGEGLPTLVIGSAIYYPRTFSNNLRQYLQLIFVDHRGFAKPLKPFTEESFAWDCLIEDIEAIRQALQLETMALIGHSGHAFFALEYAKKYPDFVSHVILIGSSPKAETHREADLYFEESVCPARKSAYEKSMQHLADDIQENPNKRFIIYSLRSAPRIWFDAQYDATSLWDEVAVIPEMFDYVWGGLLKEINIRHNLEHFNKPVLVLLGRYDYWNPPHLWEAFRAHFQNLKIRVFEKSGHTPQLEEPKLFDQELLSWLSKENKPVQNF